MRPNIVLIMTETQPTGLVGCYSGQDVRTPNLDKLAGKGVRFDRAYTSCPLCTPARAGVFTGMIPSRAGAYTNSQPLGENILNMGQRFKSIGYRTAFIGKWHLDGHDYFGKGECPAGWEDVYWYDGRRYLLDLSEEEVQLWRRGLNTIEDLREHKIKSEFTWAHRISDRAERFISEQKSREPFLLVVSFDEPHHPYTCPPEFVEPFLDFKFNIGPSAFDDLEDKPAHQKEWCDGWLSLKNPKGYYRHPMYFGCNSYVDSQIGRIVKAVEHWTDQTDNPTWIIYTADHGDHIGSHRLLNKGPTGYENNVRIPLIVVPPKNRRKACVQPSIVSHLDIMPTLLEIVSQSIPDTLDGRSFLDLTDNDTLDAERVAIAEYTRYEVGHDGFGGLEPLRMYIKWPWKLVINLHRTDELYNLKDDPEELHNCICDESAVEIRDQLHQSLIDWMDRHIDPQRGTPWQKREWLDVSGISWRFGAPMRPVPDDGVMPRYLDYDTGKPTRGTAVQYSDDTENA